MSNTFFQLSPPHTCCLVYNTDGSRMVYFNIGPDYGAKVWPAAGLTNFEEFTDPEDAATRARAIDPAFNTNIIYGSLPLLAVNVSPQEISAYVGDSIVLDCEYSCGDCDVVYEWLNPGGLAIPGATTSSLTLSDLTESLSGTYTCNAYAENAKGQTGSATGSFSVTVYPAISG